MEARSLEIAGWTALRPDGFTARLGPIWVRGTRDDRMLGFIATSDHVNNHRGSVHGGALMTFADIALGYGAVDALGAKNMVTAQLQMQFVAGSRVGDFVVCRPELVRCSSQLIFMRGLLQAGERTVASADGIWKTVDLKPDA